MLFRPFRTLLLLAVAFVAGMLYERQNQAEACEDMGGVIRGAFCE